MTKQDKPEKKDKPRTAALTFPQDVRKEALPAKKDKLCETGRKPKAQKREPEPEVAASSAPTPASAAKSLQPVDPMTLMMPFMKAGIAYSTSMLQTQIKLYDMVMQTTPLGAMTRQQAKMGKMMSQAMIDMTPWRVTPRGATPRGVTPKGGRGGKS